MAGSSITVRLELPSDKKVRVAMKTGRIAVRDDNGRLTEAIYYTDEEECARETYNSEGALIGRIGRIPDGKVTEYYASGGIRQEFHFSENEICGESVIYYPTGEVWERNWFNRGKQVRVFAVLKEGKQVRGIGVLEEDHLVYGERDGDKDNSDYVGEINDS
jgi:antitoxin component YwqK of YwqJK toxin-antitoxin module